MLEKLLSLGLIAAGINCGENASSDFLELCENRET